MLNCLFEISLHFRHALILTFCLYHKWIFRLILCHRIIKQKGKKPLHPTLPCSVACCVTSISYTGATFVIGNESLSVYASCQTNPSFTLSLIALYFTCFSVLSFFVTHIYFLLFKKKTFKFKSILIIYFPATVGPDLLLFPIHPILSSF